MLCVCIYMKAHVCVRVCVCVCVLSLGQGIGDNSVSLALILEAPQRTISQGWLTLAVTYLDIQSHTHTHTHTHIPFVWVQRFWPSELLACYTPNTCRLTLASHIRIDHIHLPTAGHIRSLIVSFFSLPSSLSLSPFSSTISLPPPQASPSLSSHPRE